MMLLLNIYETSFNVCVPETMRFVGMEKEDNIFLENSKKCTFTNFTLFSVSLRGKNSVGIFSVKLREIFLQCRAYRK